MAIQFLCPGCNQPIEVDDDQATKRAACPYCRQVVTVPEESTYRPEEHIPSARPAGLRAGPTADDSALLERTSTPGAPLPPPGSLHVGPTLPPRQRAARVWGFYALICLGVAAVLMGVLTVKAMSIWASQLGTMSTTQPLDPDEMARIQKEVVEELQAQPWLLGLSCGFHLFGVVGLALAVVSVVQSRKRNWPGIAALSICGLFVLCLFSAIVIQLALGGGVLPG